MASENYEKRREYLLSNKNLYKTALYLAWPVIIQSLLQVSVGTIDMKMVGTLGVDAISAVGTSRNIIMVFMVLVIAISTGTTAMVARFVGRGDREGASIAAGQAFMLSLLLSAFIVPLGLLTNEFSLKILGVHDGVLSYAMEYMEVFFLAVPLFLLHFMARSIFQGAGDTKTPLFIDIMMNIVNVIGNYIFIFGMFGVPAYGVAGAAMGTALSRFISVLVSWGLLLSGKFDVKVRLRHMFKPVWEASRQIMDIGIPSGLQGLSRNATTFVMFAILARTLDAEFAVPAFVIGTNLNQYALMPGLAIGTAAATLSGMNLGAKQYDRAEASGKATAILGAIVMFGISLVFVLFSGSLINFFLDDANQAVVRIGTMFLIIIGISEPLHAASIILSRTMQGAGYTKKPFQITFVSWVVIRVLLALILGLLLGLDSTGVWIAISATNIISGIWSYAVFKRGKWKEVSIYGVS
ncbi:MATE family efflux transporter [Proteiniclasticum sp. SCR006]|uniref:Probable multidrug resistance protein NorM n=1 Tax=Proteiniclasticum aestuarii TaxID=2817862 RepID=A0A939HDC9_9CLOT|nr:MATE family efflux transporter [Proteiniclasticum aestuarii]MBO1266275.1 MATE family efflux transporter [Proteiniclasticum aestuarii]